MKLYRYTLLALAALTSAGAFADDEVMKISLKDGSTVNYSVSDVDKVTFSVKEEVVKFSVTPAGGEAAKYESIPTVFRISASDNTQPTGFAFGTVEGAAPADLLAGDYALIVNISAAKVYNGEFSLADNPDSYTLKLAQYEDGKLISLREEVTSGSISTLIDSRTRKVTLKIDATFSDGTTVFADYLGMPVQASSFDELIPQKKVGNEIIVTYASTGSTNTLAISSMEISRKSSYTDYIFHAGDDSTAKIRLYNSELINAGSLSLADESVWGFVISFDSTINLGRRENGDLYSNSPIGGTLQIDKHEDGSYDIYVDVAQTYKAAWGGGTTGDGSTMTLHYTGTAN